MDTALAQLCLASMETRIELLVDESKLCEAIRVTERLRESVEAVVSKNKAPDVPSSTIDGGDNNPLHPLEGDERSQSQRDNQNILAICDRMHAWSLAKAFSMIGALRPQTLRAVLTTATNKPTQFDELINAIEIEVNSRVADVGRSATQLKKGAARPDDVNLVSAETGGDEATAIVPLTLTSRLKSMFGFAPVEKNSDAMPLQSDQQSKAESVTTDAVCSSSTPSSHHQFKTAMELEELFELGVCRRLLDQYRRECGAVEELNMAEGPDQIPRNTRHTQSRFLP